MVTVQFASAAPRIVWVAASLGSPVPKAPATTQPSVSVPVPSPGAYILVLDEASGNLAAKQVAGKAWQVQEREFTRIGTVVVKVDQGGEPAPYASITIGETTKIVTPESKGETRFHGLQLGTVRVEANFKVGDRDESTTQKFVLEAKRAEPVPTLVLSLGGTSGETGSAGGAAKAPPKSAPSSPNVPSGSMLGQILLIVLVAIGAIAGLIFGLKWIYANQDATKNALGKIGVQVPEPMSPDAPPAAPPVQAVPEPIAAIVLPDAGPIVGQAAATPHLQSAGPPRLVGASGSFELLEGVHVIGREAGLTIPLVGEATVSRRHAEIVRQGDAIVLRDLGSTNGTFVNGTRIATDQALRRGDAVQFGSVTFRIE